MDRIERLAKLKKKSEHVERRGKGILNRLNIRHEEK